MSRSASFAMQSGTNFGLMVQGADPTLPLHISMRVDGMSLGVVFSSLQRTSDAAGNTFVAARIADAAGKDAPFPAMSGVGCVDTPQVSRFRVRM